MSGTRYTDEVAADILKWIAEGTPLRQICRDSPDLPPESTIRSWVRNDTGGFRAKYHEARLLQIDSLADELLCVAYDRSIEPADKRVISENIRWLLSKLAPTRFGDRLLLAGDREAPLRHVHEDMDAALAKMTPAQLNALEEFARSTLAARAGAGVDSAVGSRPERCRGADCRRRAGDFTMAGNMPAIAAAQLASYQTDGRMPRVASTPRTAAACSPHGSARVRAGAVSQRRRGARAPDRKIRCDPKLKVRLTSDKLLITYVLDPRSKAIAK